MTTENTKALEFKFNFLLRLAKKAKEMADLVEEIHDAKKWVDLCEADLADDRQALADGEAMTKEVADTEARLVRAQKALAELQKDAVMVDAHLGNFKDDVSCLEVNVKKLAEPNTTA